MHTPTAALLTTLALVAAGCTEVKNAGRTIGHTTEDVAREIGHGTRDAAREIAAGTRRVIDEATREE
jgi:hypothetical protein